jgi:paraquat-inducible protein B
LLTGQLFVDLDFYPDSPPKQLVYGGKYPEVPTVPSALADIEKSATDILTKLKALPLDKIGNEVLATVQGTNRVANDPELKDAIRSLNAALKDIQKLTQSLDKQVVTLAAGAEKNLGAAHGILEGLEPGAPMAVDLGNALEELAAAARSIRVLSNYLERHPEALLYGKSGAGANKP